MPPKDDNNGGIHPYYVSNGRTFERIGRIEDVSIETSDVIPYSQMDLKSEMEFTASLNMTQTFQRFVLGFPMPNNWLKMHGLPMRRKRARKEAAIIGALIPKRRSIVSCCGGFSVWMGKKYEELGNAKENRSDA